MSFDAPFQLVPFAVSPDGRHRTGGVALLSAGKVDIPITAVSLLTGVTLFLLALSRLAPVVPQMSLRSWSQRKPA